MSGLKALVTGARGFAGSWLAKLLLERGDEVVGFDRGEPRRSRAWRCMGIEARGRPTRRRPARRRAGRRDRAAARGRRGLPPRRADDRRHRQRRRRSRPSRSNIAGPGTCWRPAARGGVRAGRGRLLRQGLRPARGAALHARTRRCSRSTLRRLQGGRRPDRPQLLAHLRAAGGRDPLRQHLRRRRPQLLAAGPRGRDRRAGRPPPGDPLRRQPRARLPLRRGRRRRLPGDRARRWTRGAARARRSTPAAGRPHSGARGGRADLRARRHRASSRTSAARATPRARSTASTWTRPRSARSPGGSRRSTCARGWGARSTGTARTPEARAPAPG